MNIVVLFLCLLGISYSASRLLLFSSQSEAAETAQQVQMKADQSQDDIHVTLIVYTVALGIMGIFAVYNAAEMSKRKDQFERDIRSLMIEFCKLESSLSILKNELSVKSEDIQVRARELLVEVNEKINRARADFNDRLEQQILKIEKGFFSTINGIEQKQEGIEKTIEKARRDFVNFQKAINKDFCRHLYTYHLYSLIPNYMLDSTNRTKIQSAVFWLSQNGDHEDLAIMRERITQISPADEEMVELFKMGIRELSVNLTSKLQEPMG